MLHTFQTRQWVATPREQVFAFFADPANLPPLMPKWQRARVEKAELVAPPTPLAGMVAAGVGSLITVSFRPLPLSPIRLQWDAYIAEFRWNDHFCDEQRRGPFHSFRHCHSLSDEMRGSVAGTVVSDAVEYELPLGPLGDLANLVGVKRQIRALFAYRQEMLPELLQKQFRRDG